MRVCIRMHMCVIYIFMPKEIDGLLSKCACMHVCVCLCIVCVSVCAHVCVYVCVYACACMYVYWMQHAKCVFENMNVQLCLLVCIHACISGIHGSQYEKHLYKYFIKYFLLYHNLIDIYINTAKSLP